MAIVSSDPDSGAVDIPFVIRKKDFFPNADALKKELSKKYPVKNIQIRMRNPLPHDIPYNLAILVYFVNKYVGPELKKVLSHVRKLLIMQMDAKFKPKKQQKAKRKAKKRAP
jgi:hypothetical protein